MSLTQKVIQAGKVLTSPNNIKNGGGWSSLLVPRKLNAKGGMAMLGVVGGATLVNEGFKGHNQSKIGRVSYSNTMARMTNSFNTGAVEAMHKVSRGNPAVFSDMASGVMNSNTLGGAIDTYGATPELISALYNMGG